MPPPRLPEPLVLDTPDSGFAFFHSLEVPELKENQTKPNPTKNISRLPCGSDGPVPSPCRVLENRVPGRAVFFSAWFFLLQEGQAGLSLTTLVVCTFQVSFTLVGGAAGQRPRQPKAGNYLYF